MYYFSISVSGNECAICGHNSSVLPRMRVSYQVQSYSSNAVTNDSRYGRARVLLNGSDIQLFVISLLYYRNQ